MCASTVESSSFDDYERMNDPHFFPIKDRGVAFQAVQVGPEQRSNHDVQRRRMDRQTKALMKPVLATKEPSIEEK
ncbi:hypothetical protein BN874_1350021 [Candidatus Contendobacter odensis Run_B_J11]|uniref:Uncharacterized protein n=1 Tax=Candidatus Contendobacter odensis Run_B_J11 TaxID=1400861 RepID=A0A7U7G8I2_9GAMM|nr:hypothetical protein BN874_1350021 [Candidatus Contendobacter odensis Run_B_J11]